MLQDAADPTGHFDNEIDVAGLGAIECYRCHRMVACVMRAIHRMAKAPALWPFEVRASRPER